MFAPVFLGSSILPAKIIRISEISVTDFGDSPLLSLFPAMSLREIVNDDVLHSMLCRPSNSNFAGSQDVLSAQINEAVVRQHITQCPATVKPS